MRCPVLASEETQIDDIPRSYAAGGVARVDAKEIGSAIVRSVADRDGSARNSSRAIRDALGSRTRAIDFRARYRALLEMRSTTSTAAHDKGRAG